MQEKADAPAGDQPQRRDGAALLREEAADLPGRHAQGLEGGEESAVPLRRHVNDAVEHQKAAQEHQQRRGVIGQGLPGGLLQAGLVVGQIGGIGDTGDPLVRQDLLRLGVQIPGLVQRDAQGDIVGGFPVVAGH